MNDAALVYRLAYKLSVFPIKPNGKRPIDEWRVFQERLPTMSEIMSWRTNCNLAMATGAISGVVVVDCESTEDARWFAHHYQDSPFRVRTPRGVHFWFKHPGTRISNITKVTDKTGKPRFDIRGDGGYVLLPPSKVIKNGSDVKSTGSYRRIDRLEQIDNLPTFNPTWRPDSVHKSNSNKIKDGPKYISHIHATSGSRGHDATYRSVRLLHESGLSESEALAAMIAWNETNAHPPWTMNELVHKVQSAYAKGES